MYRLIPDRDRITTIIHLWREKLNANDHGKVNLPDHGLCGHIKEIATENQLAEKFSFTFETEIGDRDKNTVSINIPASGIDTNPLGAVAEDEGARRWILRQGFLRPSGGFSGVKLVEFPVYSEFEPVEVEPPPRNSQRTYYAVACVDDPAESVQTATTQFVAECGLVRLRKCGLFGCSGNERGPLGEVNRIARGSPEECRGYSRRATDEQEIVRRHTFIWQALRGLLGNRMTNPILTPFATDALVERRGEPPLLIEIKSENGSAAIQQGLGQLLLYNGISIQLGNPSADLVLLLPSPPPEERVVRVLRAHGVCVTTYNGYHPPSFGHEFLRLCRVEGADPDHAASD